MILLHHIRQPVALALIFLGAGTANPTDPEQPSDASVVEPTIPIQSSLSFANLDSSAHLADAYSPAYARFFQHGVDLAVKDERFDDDERSHNFYRLLNDGGFLHRFVAEEQPDHASLTYLLQNANLNSTTLDDVIPQFGFEELADLTPHLRASALRTVEHYYPSMATLKLDRICTSPGWELTWENWYKFGVTYKLLEFTDGVKSTAYFRENGLLATIGREFLARPDFRPRMETADECFLTCQQIVAHVDGTRFSREDAHWVYFALRAAYYILEVLKAVHDKLALAQMNLDNEVAQMSFSAYSHVRLEKNEWTDLWRGAVSIAQVVADHFFPAWRSALTVRSALDAFADYEFGPAAQEKLRAEWTATDDDGAPRYNRTQLAEMRAKWVRNAERANWLLGNMHYVDPVIHWGEGLLSNWAFSKITAQGVEGAGGIEDQNEQTREGTMREFIRTGCISTRRSFNMMADEIIESKDVGDQGNTLFSYLTAHGNWLNPKDGFDAYLGGDLEMQVTRAVALKAMNGAFRNQQLYASCTKDYRKGKSTDSPWQQSKNDPLEPASSCDNDTSGPANVKSCVDGYACYGYRWRDTGAQRTWRNTEPAGLKQLERTPLIQTRFADVVASSVEGARLGLTDGTGYNGLTQQLKTRPDVAAVVANATNPATPGMFTLPVCFSKYNWNTAVAGVTFPWSLRAFLQRANSVKNMPCYCGANGKDTQGVWTQLGWWDGAKHRAYAVDHCGGQIRRAMDDPLERYVAVSRLDLATDLARATTVAATLRRGADYNWAEVRDVLDDAAFALGDVARLQHACPACHRAIACRTGVQAQYGIDDCAAYAQGSLREQVRAALDARATAAPPAATTAPAESPTRLLARRDHEHASGGRPQNSTMWGYFEQDGEVWKRDLFPSDFRFAPGYVDVGPPAHPYPRFPDDDDEDEFGYGSEAYDEDHPDALSAALDHGLDGAGFEWSG